jgi:hypothetical protein
MTFENFKVAKVPLEEKLVLLWEGLLSHFLLHLLLKVDFGIYFVGVSRFLDPKYFIEHVLVYGCYLGRSLDPECLSQLVLVRNRLNHGTHVNGLEGSALSDAISCQIQQPFKLNTHT